MSDPSMKVRSSSEKRSSSGKWPLWGLVLLLAGGAAWCGGTEQGAQFAEQTKSKIMSFLGMPSPAPTAPAGDQSAEPAGRIKQESGSHMVAAAINTSEQPADPDTERNARIDKAVQEARQWSDQHGSAPAGQNAGNESSQDAGSGSTAAAPGPEAGRDVSQGAAGETQASAPSGDGARIDSGAAPEKADAQPGEEKGAGQDGKAEGTAVLPGIDAGGATDQGGDGGAAGNTGAQAQDANAPASPASSGAEAGKSISGSAGSGQPAGGAGVGFSPRQGKASRGSSIDGAHAVKESRARLEGSAASGRIQRGAQAAGGSVYQGKISMDSSPADGGSGSRYLDGSYGGRLEAAAAPDEERADPVVTRDYVADTARWLASCYVPSSQSGARGYTTATLERINERGGSSSLLRSHERDPLKNRKSVLNHVFTPGMVQSLGQMYAPRFLDEMEKAAVSRSSGALDRRQIADMFRVYARRFQQASVSFLAAADADVGPLAEAIQQHGAGEREANAAFARAYTAQSRARDAGDINGARVYSQRMVESSRQASQHAAAQDRARRELSGRIMARAMGEPLPEQELSFLGQWLARRNATPDTVRAAADVCRYLSEKCAERADAIVNVGGTE